MLHNFGGNISMFGRIDEVATGPATALHEPASGKMQGIGLTMEGIEQNPVLYELMTTNVWQDKTINVDNWLKTYILNRYGNVNAHTVKAWQVLKQTVYNGKDIRDAAESIITGRPTFDTATVWTKTHLNYKRKDLLPAWDEMMKAIPACGISDGFNYDLVDITRQVLTNYAGPLQQKWVKAYQDKNIGDFEKYSRQYLQLIADVDKLLATRKDFLLGTWLADARNCGTTPAEKALYERNARDLITLWGDKNSPLHEYSCRQWSGLLNDFYKVRWQKFFAVADNALKQQKEMDLPAFDKSISQWEWQWVNTQKPYPVEPNGNSILVAQQLYQKYKAIINANL
jgi:alpha-N-acetylglucosaminidase